MTSAAGSRRRLAAPLGVAVAVALAVLGIVQRRLGRAGLQPYGFDGAEFIEHSERLRILLVLSAARETGWLEALRSIDNDYPPLVHLLTSFLLIPFGHSAEAATRSASLWLLLLAGAVAATVWQLDRRPAVAAAAWIGCLLVPALHGMATRYYFDLPFTAAVWWLVPLGLVSWERRPVAGGIATGALWFAACMLKWTALPVGLIVMTGVFLAPGSSRWDRRVTAFATAIATGVALLALWFVILGAPGSFGGTRGMNETNVGALGEVAGGARSGLIGGALDALAARTPVARLLFYGAGTVFAVLSPLLAAPIAALCGLSLARRPRLWVLLGVVILGQIAFLVLLVGVLDERFLSAVAPALVVGAALGWGALGPRLRLGSGALVVGLGLLVALEFHAGVPASDARVVQIVNPAPQQPPNLVRGLWATDSVEQRGWGAWRAEDDWSPRRRADLWAALQAAKPTSMLVTGDPDVGTAAIDRNWLNYRVRLQRLEEGGSFEVRYGEECGDADLIATREAPSSLSRPPACPGAWRRLGAWPRTATPHRAALWAREPAP